MFMDSSLKINGYADVNGSPLVSHDVNIVLFHIESVRYYSYTYAIVYVGINHKIIEYNVILSAAKNPSLSDLLIEGYGFFGRPSSGGERTLSE